MYQAIQGTQHTAHSTQHRAHSTGNTAQGTPLASDLCDRCVVVVAVAHRLQQLPHALHRVSFREMSSFYDAVEQLPSSQIFRHLAHRSAAATQQHSTVTLAQEHSSTVTLAQEHSSTAAQELGHDTQRKREPQVCTRQAVQQHSSTAAQQHSSTGVGSYVCTRPAVQQHSSTAAQHTHQVHVRLAQVHIQQHQHVGMMKGLTTTNASSREMRGGKDTINIKQTTKEQNVSIKIIQNEHLQK